MRNSDCNGVIAGGDTPQLAHLDVEVDVHPVRAVAEDISFKAFVRLPFPAVFEGSIRKGRGVIHEMAGARAVVMTIGTPEARVPSGVPRREHLPLDIRIGGIGMPDAPGAMKLWGTGLVRSNGLAEELRGALVRRAVSLGDEEVLEDLDVQRAHGLVDDGAGRQGDLTGGGPREDVGNQREDDLVLLEDAVLPSLGGIGALEIGVALAPPARHGRGPGLQLGDADEHVDLGRALEIESGKTALRREEAGVMEDIEVGVLVGRGVVARSVGELSEIYMVDDAVESRGVLVRVEGADEGRVEEVLVDGVVGAGQGLFLILREDGGDEG